MKKILLAIILAFTGASALNLDTANEETAQKDVTLSVTINGETKDVKWLIAGGPKGMSYISAAKTLEKQLGKDALSFPTSGSVKNTELLLNGEVNVAFIQSDILAMSCGKNPNMCKNVSVYKTTLKEKFTMLCRAGTDLQGKTPISVYVGPIDSGGSGTLDNLKRLESDYNFKKITGGKISLASVHNVINDKYKCLAFTSSRPAKDYIVSGLKGGLKLMDIDDSALNNSITIGNKEQQIYKFEDIVIPYEKGIFSDTKAKAETVEVTTWIVFRDDLMSDDQKDKILRVLEKYKLNGGLF